MTSKLETQIHNMITLTKVIMTTILAQTTMLMHMIINNTMSNTDNKKAMVVSMMEILNRYQIMPPSLVN